MESLIKESLTSLLNGISAANGPAIAAEMERLDAFLLGGRAKMHPQLAHYLQNRSYAKALAWLGGEVNLTAGTCGGRPARPAGAV